MCWPMPGGGTCGCAYEQLVDSTEKALRNAYVTDSGLEQWRKYVHGGGAGGIPAADLMRILDRWTTATRRGLPIFGYQEAPGGEFSFYMKDIGKWLRLY